MTDRLPPSNLDTSPTASPSAAARVASDPTALDAVSGSGGVVWSASPPGVHVNLVVLDPGGSIGRHVNEAVDVVIVVLAGQATISVDESEVPLGPHDSTVIPRGARRGVSAGSPGVRYLSIHTERPPPDLTPSRRSP